MSDDVNDLYESTMADFYQNSLMDVSNITVTVMLQSLDSAPANILFRPQTNAPLNTILLVSGIVSKGSNMAGTDFSSKLVDITSDQSAIIVYLLKAADPSYFATLEAVTGRSVATVPAPPIPAPLKAPAPAQVPAPALAPACVTTEKALRNAVTKARTNGPRYTRINLCTTSLTLSVLIDDYGIDVSRKWLDIRCGLKQARRCALNGQGLNGFFYGTRANIKIDRVDFVNGQISHSSFLRNKAPIILNMVQGDLFKLNNVTFAQNSFANYFDFPYSAYIYNVTEVSISSTLFNNNSNTPLFVYRGETCLITDSSFKSNYNIANSSSALEALYTKITLKRVSFVNNILSKKKGNTLGIAYSRIRLDGCNFANNDGPAGSTESSSVRVYDGDKDYEDESKPSTRRKSTLTCSKTKFCDGFAQKKPIVDQFSKTFNASTCTASRNC